MYIMLYYITCIVYYIIYSSSVPVILPVVGWIEGVPSVPTDRWPYYCAVYPSKWYCVRTYHSVISRTL